MLTTPPGSARTGQGRRKVQSVLVCDDDLAVRYTLKRLLATELAAEATEAEHGLSALKALRTHVPDLLILDLHMPFVNGVETLRAIRSTPSLAHLPVIVLTSECDAEVVRTVIELGVTDYLSKPLSRSGTRDRLKRIIASLEVDARAVSRHRDPADGPALLAGSKLLVADASEDFRYFIRTTFGTRFRVIEATTGVDALDIALNARPHAVMLGRNLTLLEADQVAQKLRSQRVRENLVLLAVCGRGEMDDVRGTGLYDAVIPRTFVPDAFTREFDALGPASLPLAQLLEKCPTLRAQISSASEQVFGMMLRMDVEPRDRVLTPFTPPFLAARIPIDLDAALTARVDLIADLSSADAFAVAMFGVPEASEAMAELSNIIAGRIKHAFVTDNIPAVLGLPDVQLIDTGEPQARPADAIGVRFGVAGTDHEIDVRLTASVRPAAAADAARSTSLPAPEGMSS